MQDKQDIDKNVEEFFLMLIKKSYKHMVVEYETCIPADGQEQGSQACGAQGHATTETVLL